MSATEPQPARDDSMSATEAPGREPVAVCDQTACLCQSAATPAEARLALTCWTARLHFTVLAAAGRVVQK
jgi:hypothetical protein